jgi:hypothetical protein
MGTHRIAEDVKKDTAHIHVAVGSSTAVPAMSTVSTVTGLLVSVVV